MRIILLDLAPSRHAYACAPTRLVCSCTCAMVPVGAEQFQGLIKTFRRTIGLRMESFVLLRQHVFL